MESVFFIIFGLVAIISALRVVFVRNMLHAILWLVVTFFSTACLYVMLQAEFLAAMQVLVYAGAIIILYVFAIMLVNLRETQTVPQFHKQKPVALVVGLLLLGELGLLILPKMRSLFSPEAISSQESNAIMIGRLLYTDYAFAFELISLILLVAIIGAVVLAMRREEQ